jgi:hypothetical protein
MQLEPDGDHSSNQISLGSHLREFWKLLNSKSGNPSIRLGTFHTNRKVVIV